MRKIIFTILILIIKNCSGLAWDTRTVSEIFSQNTINQLSLYLPQSNCSQVLFTFIRDILTKDQYAVQIFDSWGSGIPSGIQSTNNIEFGHYDQCKQALFTLDKVNWLPSQYVLSSMSYEKRFISYGSCLPSVCSALEVSVIMRAIAPELQMTFNNVVKIDNGSKAIDENLKTLVYIGISLLLFLTIVSSIYDLACGKKENTSAKVFTAFSVFSNGRNLLEPRMSAGAFSSLDGIRVISFFLIVLYHSTSASSSSPRFKVLPATNNYFILHIHVISLASYLVVETFFLLSGLLLSYQFIKSQEKGPNFNLIQFYIKRWLRLLPPLFFMQWTFVAFASYVTGPDTNSLETMLEQYKLNPFTTLFFDHPYGHLWYVASEFRLSVVAPILLLGLRKYGYKFFIFLIPAAIGSFIYQVYLLDSGTNIITPLFNTRARCGPWLIGILLGYILYRERKRNFRIHPIVAQFLLTICVVGLIALLNEQGQSPFHTSDDTLARFVWTIIMSVIIVLLLKEKLPGLAWLLSHPTFQLVAKLTYSAYLWHQPIIEVTQALQRTPVYLNFFLLFQRIIAVTGIALLLAVPWCLIIEMPLMNLERVKWGEIFNTKQYDYFQLQGKNKTIPFIDK